MTTSPLIDSHLRGAGTLVAEFEHGITVQAYAVVR